VFVLLPSSSLQSSLPNYKAISFLFLQLVSLSLRRSLQALLHSFAASSAYSHLHSFALFVNTASSSYPPYKGAVVVNGILYCPYQSYDSFNQTSQAGDALQTFPSTQPDSHDLKPKKSKPRRSIKMAPQNFGALGATYTVVRGMQAISMISIIGMTANFISEMVSAKQSPPSVLIGTLSVVSISTYSFITLSNTIPDMHCCPLCRCNLYFVL
jgi:hypothetical protein